eukprot:gene4786-15088_t
MQGRISPSAPVLPQSISQEQIGALTSVDSSGFLEDGMRPQNSMVFD